MKRILVATDVTAQSERALRRAAILGKQFGSELYLLTVVPDDCAPTHLDQISREVAIAFSHFTADLEPIARTRPTVLVRIGTVGDAIISAAREMSADLVILGAHRKDICKDIFVSSVAEQVLRAGCYPLLAVNQPAYSPYGSALLPVDMSHASAHGIAVARSLGLLDGIPLAVLHAHDGVDASILLRAALSQKEIEAQTGHATRTAFAELEHFVRNTELDDLQYQTFLEEGDAISAIKVNAKRLRPNLLVIGTSGPGRLSRTLLGSVTEEVLRDANCDVLAVPRPCRKGETAESGPFLTAARPDRPAFHRLCRTAGGPHSFLRKERRRHQSRQPSASTHGGTIDSPYQLA